MIFSKPESGIIPHLPDRELRHNQCPTHYRRGISVTFAVTHCAEEVLNPKIRIVGSEGSIQWEADHQYVIAPEMETFRCGKGEELRLEMLSNLL